MPTAPSAHDFVKIPITIIELTNNLLKRLSLDHVEGMQLLTEVKTIGQIVSELGIQGRVYTKTAKGKTYLIVKGYAGRRAVITGTRYLIDNPKIAHIAVTPKQLVRGALKGTIFQIVAYTTLNAFDAIFCHEDKQLATFVGKTSSDFLKVAASSGAGAIASMALASLMGVSVLAAGPLILGVAVAIGAGYLMDKIDEKYNLTNRLIAAIDKKLIELDHEVMRAPREFQRQWWRWERWFKDDPNSAMRALFGG